MPTFVADTHAIIWFLAGDKRLGERARITFKKIEKGTARLVIPIVVLQETTYLFEKARIKLSVDDILEKLETINCIFYPTDGKVFNNFRKISPKLTLNDRTIIATAKLFKAKLITKDK